MRDCPHRFLYIFCVLMYSISVFLTAILEKAVPQDAVGAMSGGLRAMGTSYTWQTNS